MRSDARILLFAPTIAIITRKFSTLYSKKGESSAFRRKFVDVDFSVYDRKD